jgi:hypothetical protein
VINIQDMDLPPGYRLVRVGTVAASDSAVYAAIQRTWDRLVADDPRVPGIVIDMTPGRPSSCTSVGWRDTPPIVQINLKHDGKPDGPNLTGAELLTWLLHQAAHGITGPVTGQEGRAHSTKYRDAAISLGFDVDRDPTGYGATSLAAGTRTRYRAELAALDRALARWEPTRQVKATRDSRNPVPYICSCDPPRRMRMQAKTFDLGPVTCEICGMPFELASASSRGSA